MNVNFGNKESVIFDDTRNLFKQENLKESIDQINNGILKDIRLVHPNQQDIQDLKPILKQNQTEFVLKGIINDFVVNIKKNNKNYGKIYNFKLTTGEALIIPKTFAA